MISKVRVFLVLTSALLTAASSAAATVRWSLNDVVFNDGATAIGTLDWDAASEIASTWNISVSEGLLSAFNYNPNNSIVGAFDQGDPQKEFLFVVIDSARQLRLTPTSPLTDAGGSVPIDLNTNNGGAGSVECNNCDPFRTVVSGSFDAEPALAPEPPLTAMIAVGLVGVFCVMLRLPSRSNPDRTL